MNPSLTQPSSRKRSLSNQADEDLTECGTLMKKIKNIHLSTGDGGGGGVGLTTIRDPNSIVYAVEDHNAVRQSSGQSNIGQSSSSTSVDAHLLPCPTSSSSSSGGSAAHLMNSAQNAQKLLSEQIVNYGNQIIGNNYTPSLGPVENCEYFETNRVLFEANKMRLLRAQVRLLEQ